MRKLLGTIFILGIMVLIFGFFRGWFSFDKQDNRSETNVQIKVDKDRIKEDTRAAADKVKEFTDE